MTEIILQSQILPTRVDGRLESIYVVFRQNIVADETIRFPVAEGIELLVDVGKDRWPIAVQFVGGFEHATAGVEATFDMDELIRCLFSATHTFIDLHDQNQRSLCDALIRDAVANSKKLLGRRWKDVMETAKRLEAEGGVDSALDLIYGAVDDLLLAGRFDECGRLLDSTDPAECSTAILLVLLTVTQPAESKLPRRENFMGLVRKILRRRGLNTEELLAGLEGECPDAIRAGGDVVCQACGKAYYDHPQHGGFPFLNILCDGTAVKL